MDESDVLVTKERLEWCSGSEVDPWPTGPRIKTWLW